MAMSRIHLKRSNRRLTCHAGLTTIRLSPEAAQRPAPDVREPYAKGMRTSDTLKSDTGLVRPAGTTSKRFAKNLFSDLRFSH
ncbi:protein of unknown function [Methylococcus capsulatus]|uniref:Uncharacterized protein n=1 Tax=Methylococcus capsulatus TaxID=414 RepID=A0AA35UN30_METCP|nr:protein of unknown function [Methylococcus capsulatus]